MAKKDPIISALEKQTKAIASLTKTLESFIQINGQIKSGVLETVSTGETLPEIATETVSQSRDLENLETTTGQLPEQAAQSNDEVSREELERALNINQTNVFGTTNFDTFKNRLDGMTYAAMQELAAELQMNKFEMPPILKNQLEKAFFAKNQAAGALNKIPKPHSTRVLNPNNPDDLRAMQALGMKF